MTAGRIIVTLAALLAACAAGVALAAEKNMEKTDNTAVATFAGGCFWCTEADFEKLPGVVEVVSGYSGGSEPNPTYKEVSAGRTGHLESIQVRYDPTVVSYRQLLDHFWRHVDPTDPGGSFVDRGRQYTSAIFFHDEEQRKLAEETKRELEEAKVFDKPIVTEIWPFESFWPAEGYHQDYYKDHALKYGFYRYNSGRDQFLRKIWGENMDRPIKSGDGKPGKSELKARLTPLQYEVTQEEGTEPPFRNEYWDNHREGIYVDVVSGEPLFSSRDKFESGTGWPSFTRPLVPENIVTREDRKLFRTRVEVRSSKADSHLGHIFEDGPPPTGLRYCMNSAAMRFIPKEELAKEGYGEFAKQFE